MVADRLVTMEMRTLSLTPSTSLGLDFISRHCPTSPLLIGALVDMRNYIPRSQLWGIVGQERFQSLRVAFYRGVDNCVVVYGNSGEGMGAERRWKQDF